MIKQRAALITLITLFVGAATTASATSNSNAKIALHLQVPTTKNTCSQSSASPACDQIVTQGSLYPSTYFAFLLIVDGNPDIGIAGLQCGITYDGRPESGVDIYSWTNCATLEFSSGDWPASGSGNLITWDRTTRCQQTEPGGPGTGVVAVAGYFYCAAYGPDTLKLTTRPADGVAMVADCQAKSDTLASSTVIRTPSYLGYAAFSASGSDPGYNPCAGCSFTSKAVADHAIEPVVTMDKANITLGTVSVPSEAKYNKALVLNGVFLKGLVTATYLDGISYLNGLRWRPPVVPETAKNRSDPSRPVQFRALAAADSEAFLRSPYVRAQVAAGKPLLIAANDFLIKMHQTLGTVKAEYARRRVSQSIAEAGRNSARLLDRDIAVYNPNDPLGPKFGRDGTITITFTGYGSYFIAPPAAGVVESGFNSVRITRTEAAADLERLVTYVRYPGPAVLVYGAKGRTLCGGNDALAALAEIRECLQNNRVSDTPQRILSPNELREILAAGRQK